MTGGKKIKVAVIGAGAAGLCAAKHLSTQGDEFEFILFEQQDDVGGTWYYSTYVVTDKYGLPVHSSMYDNLRTNLPKEVMAFPGFPFHDCNGKSFVHHTDVLQYLKNYTEYYNLLEYIKFHTIVTRVTPKNTSLRDPKWIVDVCDVLSNEKSTHEFDAVMVCNGHYSVPYIPTIPGLESYKGLLVHSHDYRNNIGFRNMKVVVLGAGASGIDIAIEISNVAEEVVLSHDGNKFTCPLPSNFTEEPGIQSVSGKSVTFTNKKSYECDAVVLCTGYQYTYRFLHESCGIQVNNKRVQPLYMHMFHAKFPTLGIWAITKRILPFPMYNQQVIVFLKHLKGEISLPSEEDMLKSTELDFQSRLNSGLEPRHAHLMRGHWQWDFDDLLSVLGKIEPLPKSTRGLFEYVSALRKGDLLNYKDNNFKIVNEDEFIHI